MKTTKKKNIICQNISIITFVLILLAILTTITPVVHAEEIWEGDFSQVRDKIYTQNSVAGVAYDVATTAEGCNPHFNFANLAKTIYSIQGFSGTFKVGTFLGKDYTLIKAGVSMYEYMKVIGIALIFLFFLIDLLDEVQADSFTIEHLIKKLITLTVAIVVLNMGGTIFDYICQFSDALLDDVATATSGGNGGHNTIAETIMKSGGDGIFSSLLLVLGAIGIMLKNIVGYLLFLVAFIIAYLISFSRFIELLVRFVFAPIGMAQLVSGGAKGPGMRYIKKFASCALQGAVCVAAFGAADIVKNQASGLNGIFAQILVPITLIGFLMKTGRIADDVVGV